MPGFLEDETVFNKKYTRYLNTSLKKLNDKKFETQAFLNAIKSLRTRIQPFVMRRTKEEVMKELPEKILLDYPCLQSRVQRYLFDLFERLFPYLKGIGRTSPKKTGKRKNGFLFNNLVHKRLCNHPDLALTNETVKDALD